MKEKDDAYFMAVSEIRNGIFYNPLSVLTSIISRLSNEYGLDWEEVHEDIGVDDW